MAPEGHTQKHNEEEKVTVFKESEAKKGGAGLIRGIKGTSSSLLKKLNQVPNIKISLFFLFRYSLNLVYCRFSLIIVDPSPAFPTWRAAFMQQINQRAQKVAP